MRTISIVGGESIDVSIDGEPYSLKIEQFEHSNEDNLSCQEAVMYFCNEDGLETIPTYQGVSILNRLPLPKNNKIKCDLIRYDEQRTGRITVTYTNPNIFSKFLAQLVSFIDTAFNN